MAVTDEVSQDGAPEVDAGYIDLTVEELVAAASAMEAAPPAHVVGGPSIDRETIETAVRVGRRSLRARGLLRTADDVEQIDEALAQVALTAGSPAALTTVTSVDAAERSVTWCYVDDDNLVVSSTLEPGLFRIRLLPAEALGAALGIISGLDAAEAVGSVPEFSVDLSGAVSAVESGAPDPSDAVVDAISSALSHLDPGALEALTGSSGRSTSVAMVRRGSDGETGVTQVSWWRTDDHRWSEIAVDDEVLRGRPTTPAELRSRLVEVLGSAPHS